MSPCLLSLSYVSLPITIFIFNVHAYAEFLYTSSIPCKDSATSPGIMQVAQGGASLIIQRKVYYLELRYVVNGSEGNSF